MTVLMPNHFQVLIRAIIGIGHHVVNVQKTGSVRSPVPIRKVCTGPRGPTR
jgi:hypothetical protein